MKTGSRREDLFRFLAENYVFFTVMNLVILTGIYLVLSAYGKHVAPTPDAAGLLEALPGVGDQELGRLQVSAWLGKDYGFLVLDGDGNALCRQGDAGEISFSEETLAEIMRKVLPRRAKLRCLNLLKSRSYTEKQLAEKLRAGKYPEAVIEEALSYVKSFGYVDDAAYARSYAEDQIEKKSVRRIAEELQRKGVDRGLIEEALLFVQERDGGQDEEGMIRRLLEKKHFDPETADFAEKRRIQAFLMRKGFTADGIRRAMNG